MSPAADEKAELGHHGFTCFYGDDKSVPKSKFTITTNWFDIMNIPKNCSTSYSTYLTGLLCIIFCTNS
jgi:hypothetical protein